MNGEVVDVVLVVKTVVVDVVDVVVEEEDEVIVLVVEEDVLDDVVSVATVSTSDKASKCRPQPASPHQE